MKNLANCTPREFLVQSNKIRKSVEKWLTLTKVIEIRKKLPDLKEDISEEEKKEAIQKQAVQNISLILNAALDEYPEETLELLALLCFIEPADIDNYKVADLLKSATELINDEAVIGFFTSLARLGMINI